MRTIYFDFGNVIGFFDHWKSVNALLRYTTIGGTELYDALYEGPLEDSYERGAISTAEYIAEACSRGKLTCSPAEFLAGFEDIFTPNAEVCDAIPHLAAEYRILLASNTNDGHFTHYCKQFKDVLSHFAALPTSHQAKARKPEPAFFEYAQWFANAEPRDCVFVDDLAINIAAGERHGWKTVHYEPGNLQAKLQALGIAI